MNFNDNYTEKGKNKTKGAAETGPDNFDIGSLPFIIQRQYIQNHRTEIKDFIQAGTRNKDVIDELSAIKRQLKRPVVPIQRYAKTKHAAVYLDVDSSYLTKRMGKVFREGKHYFYPENESIIRWDLEELERWIKNEEKKEAVDDFLSDIEL